MSKDNKKNNQHYVPRSQLIYFANPKMQCYVYDITSNKFFYTNRDNIVNKRHFYDFPKEIQEVSRLKDNHFIENQLADIEGQWKKYTDILDTHIECVQEHYRIIVQYIVIQMLRTPKGITSMTNTNKDLYEHFPKQYIKMLDNTFLSIQIALLLTPKTAPVLSPYYNYIQDNFRQAHIGINKTDIPFITSDNPIIFLSTPWDKETTMIYYPVKPDRCIMLWNEAKDNYDNARELTQEEVLQLNTACKTSAERFIISNQDMEKNILWNYKNELEIYEDMWNDKQFTFSNIPQIIEQQTNNYHNL